MSVAVQQGEDLMHLWFT